MMFRSWAVLFAFCLMTNFNAFQFMNYASISSISKESFHINSQQLNWLYSASLVAVLPTAAPIAYLLDHHNYLAMLIGAISTCLPAWLRYLAALHSSYPLALASSVLLGLSSAVVISCPTQIARDWFPANQRTLVTTIAVQSNYFGWCLGGIVTPHVVDSSADLRTFLLWQAIASCSVIITFFAFHRAPTHAAPQSGEEDSATVEASLIPRTHRAVIATLLSNKSFMLSGLGFALLGGVSFAVPAVQDQVFDLENFSADANSFANLAFIASGVLVGLLAGALAPPRHHPLFLSLSFLATALSLTALSLVSHFHASFASHSLLFATNLSLMAVAGAGSLGFIGIGLATAARLGHPVSDTYTGGGVEWFLQVFSVVLTQASTDEVGFVACAVVAWAALAALVAGQWVGGSSGVRRGGVVRCEARVVIVVFSRIKNLEAQLQFLEMVVVVLVFAFLAASAWSAPTRSGQPNRFLFFSSYVSWESIVLIGRLADPRTVCLFSRTQGSHGER